MAISAVNYAVLTRMQVSAQLEAGPFGSPGIRKALDEVFYLQNDAVEAMKSLVRETIEPFIEIVKAPTDIYPNLDFGEPGVLRIGAESTEFGGLTTKLVPISYYEQFQLSQPNFGGNRKFLDAWYEKYDKVLDSSLGKIGYPAVYENRGTFEDLAFFGKDIPGTSGDDELRSTSDGFGARANDFIVGLDGNDTIWGSSSGGDALRGDNGNDLLYGRGGSDFLTGGSGDDIIDGGDGVDIARYLGRSANYTIEGGTGSARVTGPDGTDHLFDVETIVFDDRQVTLDKGDLALEMTDEKRMALLYEAALNRNGDIDKAGLNFWIDTKEGGLSDSDIAFHFLDSDEFVQNFGDYHAMSGRDLVETLYSNVLNRDGEKAGVDFWTDVYESDAEFDQADLLLSFAISGENLDGSPFINRLFEVEEGTWDFV